MHYKLVPLILLSSILFLCNDVEAGFNGDEPIGNDWIIDQYTHVWDEDISIENIALNNGGLKLENVTLYLTGDFYLKADAEWINSNITYDKKDKTNQLTVETNLYLINTTLGINSTIDHVFNATIEGILLEPNSELIITDSDNNPLTQYDQSRLYSLNWNNSDSEFTSLEIWSPGNGKVNINNSHISHYALIKSHNNNVTFTNNTFDECRTVANINGDNFTFEYNTVDRWWGQEGEYSVQLYSSINSVISNNTFHRSYDAIGIYNSQNITLNYNNFTDTIENYGWSFYLWNVSYAEVKYNNFVNHTGIPFTLSKTNNSVISNNIFLNSSGPNNIFLSGFNNTISDNIMNICGTDWVPSMYGLPACIEINGYYVQDYDNLFGPNLVKNNVITNFTKFSIFVSGISDIVINNNTIINGTGDGIYLDSDYGSSLAPSNTIISNNLIKEVDWGIGLGGGDSGMYHGEDNQIYNNTIIDSNIGINIIGGPNLYEDILVRNNSINTIDTSLIVLGIKNSIFVDNVLFSSAGIDAKECTNISFNDNMITSSKVGINLNNSEGKINNNEIIGLCQEESCDKIGFQRVSDKGIIISALSNINVENNTILYFNTGIYSNKAFIVILENFINSTYNSINIISSAGTINENIIVNASNGIYILDSPNISLVGNQIDNYDVGIYSINSTINIGIQNFQKGEFCINLLDSNYTISPGDNHGCQQSFLNENYNVRMYIINELGNPFDNHQFSFNNSIQTKRVYGETNSDGYSNYFEIPYKIIETSGSEKLFNPYKFYYSHNSIMNEIEVSLFQNMTVYAYLDTVPPSSTIICNSTLINTEDFYLYFNILDLSEDLKEYDIEYIEHDGIHFSSWQKLGTFNESEVLFNGKDNSRYRFRSLAKDIHNNKEIKEGYDYETTVDSTKPESHFVEIDSDYYFTNLNEIKLQWDSIHTDVNSFIISIYFTNFTNPYLDPDSVIWNLQEVIYRDSAGELSYPLNETGHYAFQIKARDEADNIELNDDYNFIINYDPNSDGLRFVDVPSVWGQENIDIQYNSSNDFLTFDLFIALESIDSQNNQLTWYNYEYNEEYDYITLEGLQDSVRYYLVAKSIDLAENLEDPLNTTEIFDSNGNYDQSIQLKYYPITKNDYSFNIKIDVDGDGFFEEELTKGNNLSKLGIMEYYLDEENKTVHFGGLKNGGYVPIEAINNILITYSGVHAIFEVSTMAPMGAKDLRIEPTNTTHMVISFTISKDVAECKVQRSTNLSLGWFNQMIISPCYADNYEYIENNPNLEKVYNYRILTSDQFGHSSYSDNDSIDMQEVVKIFSTSTSVESDFGIDEILPISLLIGTVLLVAGGVLVYQSRKQELIDENFKLVDSKPVAKYRIEDLYLIYKDGRLIESLTVSETKTDSDIMSGMLTAINDFVQDSFQTKGDLGSIDYGENKVVLQRGDNCYLAVVVYGEVDKFLRSKLANIVRDIEAKNTNLANWNGDASAFVNIKTILKPLIDETRSANREMVDNYLSKKDISLTTEVKKINDKISIFINISNYSSVSAEDCRICPIINSSILALSGINPDLSYSFAENTFYIGSLESYNETQLRLDLKIKGGNPTNIDLELTRTHRGRDITSSTTVSLM